MAKHTEAKLEIHVFTSTLERFLAGIICDKSILAIDLTKVQLVNVRYRYRSAGQHSARD